MSADPQMSGEEGACEGREGAKGKFMCVWSQKRRAFGSRFLRFRLKSQREESGKGAQRGRSKGWKKLKEPVERGEDATGSYEASEP